MLNKKLFFVHSRKILIIFFDECAFPEIIKINPNLIKTILKNDIKLQFFILIFNKRRKK